MHKPIRILHVSPLSTERELVQCALEKEHSDFQVIGASSRQEFEARLEEHEYDLVLSDTNISGLEGLQIIDRIKAKDPHLPVVFVIESTSEETAVEVMEQGASDYVLKTSQYIRLLPYTIWAVLKKKYLQDERERAEEILWKYAERLELVSKIDQAVDASLKQQTERLETLHEIYRSILEALSSEAIAEAALEHLRRLVPYQQASIVAFSLEADNAVILATQGNKTKLRAGMHLPLSAFPLTKALKRGKVRVVKDISKLSHPTSTDQILLKENIRAYLNVPLITQDKLIGTLNLGANTPYPFTSEHIEIAREVADQVAIAIQQAHLYEQVQRYATELEQRVAERTAELSSANAEMERVASELRQLVDTANAPIFGIDTNGLVNEWNQTAAKITSYRKDEVIGRNLVEDFIPEEHKTSVKEVLDQALEGIETANFEFPLYTKHGQRLIVLLNASARRDVSGEIIGVVGVGQDITERRRAEKALSWEAGVNAGMAELSRALMTTSSIPEISCRVLEHAKRFTNSKFGYVGYIDLRTGNFVCPAMSKDIWDSCQPPKEDDVSFKTASLLGKWVLENRKSLLTNNLVEPLGLTGLPQVPLSFHNFLSAPAWSGETIVGQISLANSDRDYAGRDLAMLERLAQLYALALERKWAEKELRQLSVAVEQSAASIVITDLDGKIIFVNKAFEKSTGYTKEEALGQNPRILETDYLPKEVYEDLWKTITAGGVWSGEFLNKRKNGSTYWESAVISPITNPQGEIVNYIAVKEDITQRKVAEEDLKKAKEEAEVANKLKSEFLANMSHEIRTPMNAILGFTDLLFDKETDPTKREKFEIVKRSGKNLLNLINDILDFSKIEAGKIAIEKRQFVLRNMLEYIHSQFSVKAAKQHLVFTVNIDKTIPQIVYGDEYRINQIILNILSNAFKFTNEGSIVLDCAYQQGTAIIRVSDTGIGIPEEKHHVVFSPFEQVDSSTIRRRGGTGLGMAITKRLIELMGGSIFFESHVGVGSTFTVELPLPGVKEEESKEEGFSQNESRGQTGAMKGERMVRKWLRNMQGNPALEGILVEGITHLPEKVRILEDAILRNIPADIKFVTRTLKSISGDLGMTEIYSKALEIEQEIGKKPYQIERVKNGLDDLKNIVSSIPKSYFQEIQYTTQDVAKMASQFDILVAEDNEINQRLIQEFLRGMSLHCDLADNGKIALDKLKKKTYAILLLDMQMPVMDGLETIKRIRADESLKDLYVIALTAHAMKGDAEKYMNLGCNDYLSKPVRKEQFRERIYHVLVKHLMQQDKVRLIDRTTSDDRKTSRVLLSQKQRRELHTIIQGLRENYDIFNPGHVCDLADKLESLSPARELQNIRDKLYAAADTFDDQAIEPIVKTLEEIYADRQHNPDC